MILMENEMLNKLADKSITKKYKVDFLKVIRETHSIAIEERPFSKHGTEILNILGDEYNLCLKGKKSAENSLNDASNKITALGLRW